MTARTARKAPDWTGALLDAANAAETTDAVVALVRNQDARLIEYRATHYAAYCGVMDAIFRRIDELKKVRASDDLFTE